MSKDEIYVPVMDDVPLPDVKKTAQMLTLEEQHGGMDIRLLIKSIYEETGSQKAVADRLGLEQSTMTVWALRLGLEFASMPIVRIKTHDGGVISQSVKPRASKRARANKIGEIEGVRKGA